MPFNWIDAGCVEALVEILAVALVSPELVGAKVKVKLALDVGAMVVGTVRPVNENCLFETETEEICRGAAPVFLMVTCCVACWPTVTVWKFTALVDSDIPGVALRV